MLIPPQPSGQLPTRAIDYNNLMSKELYLEKLKEIRKYLRKNPTTAEEKLWQNIRKMKLGYKFRRQVSIGYFVVDFYCKDISLAIEIDGTIHNKKSVQEKDNIRQEIIESDGIFFLRFTNNEVNNKIQNVLKKIKNTCDQLRYHT